MGKKSTQDYINDGIYGVKLPKQKERDYFLGTLRERIVLALTIGQVMSDHGIQALEVALKDNKGATLLLNGAIAPNFLKREKELANQYHTPYTEVTNEEVETDIGAVLTYDYAIEKEDIFLPNENASPKNKEADNSKEKSLAAKIKDLFH